MIMYQFQRLFIQLAEFKKLTEFIDFNSYNFLHFKSFESCITKILLCIIVMYNNIQLDLNCQALSHRTLLKKYKYKHKQLFTYWKSKLLNKFQDCICILYIYF